MPRCFYHIIISIRICKRYFFRECFPESVQLGKGCVSSNSKLATFWKCTATYVHMCLTRIFSNFICCLIDSVAKWHYIFKRPRCGAFSKVQVHSIGISFL